jgi:hypothetical protein
VLLTVIDVIAFIGFPTGSDSLAPEVPRKSAGTPMPVPVAPETVSHIAVRDIGHLTDISLVSATCCMSVNCRKPIYMSIRWRT